MTRIITYCIIFLCTGTVSIAQTKTPHTDQLDITGTLGASQGTASLAWVHAWQTGKQHKFEWGLGLRNTLYAGTKKDYLTAPAKLARTTTFPFAIVFAGQQEKNFDTLTVQRPLVNSTALTINLGYHFTNHWYFGTNIDLVGIAFGRTGGAILTSNGTTTTETAAKPATFNLLLTGDNDLGNLNSEFFLKYNVNKKIALRGVYQFIFTEYKTQHIYQVAPDGTQVYRFRNKANNFGLGITYDL